MSATLTREQLALEVVRLRDLLSAAEERLKVAHDKAEADTAVRQQIFHAIDAFTAANLHAGLLLKKLDVLR